MHAAESVIHTSSASPRSLDLLCVELFHKKINEHYAVRNKKYNINNFILYTFGLYIYISITAQQIIELLNGKPLYILAIKNHTITIFSLGVSEIE